MMLKKIFKLKLLILLLSVFCNLHSFSFFADYKANKNYQNKDYQSAREILQKEQTDDPNNALINYNLGTIDYKLNKQQSAKNNFQRAVNFSKSNELKEKAYFNWGNSLYKNSQNILGKDWENKKVDDKKIEQATKELESGIEKYKNALVINKENEKTEANLKAIEEILQKLIAKQQEQKQQQDKDKDQDKNQDQQNKQEQSKQDNSSEKQQGSEDKGDQKVQEEQQEGSKENASDKQEENKNNGEKDELNKEHGQEEQEKIDNHDDNSSEKEEQTQPGEEGTQQEEENQALREEEANSAMQAAVEPEEQETTDLKKREMISLLEKLQDDESKRQKQMLWQKSKGLQRPQNNAQRPW